MGMKEKYRKMFATQTSVQIYDNSQMILSRCKRIIECSQTYIKLDMGNIMLEISGYDLMVNDNNTEGVSVCGRIDSVSLTPTKVKVKDDKV